MKRNVPFLLIMLFLAQVSFAQFGLGIKAGANITKIDGKSFKDEFRYGYHLGAYANIGLGGRFSIQPEVLFNQYNTRTDSSFKSIYQNAFSGNNSIKLNYLSIPILLNYKLGSLLSLQAGPQFGVLMDRNRSLLQNGKDAFDKGDLSLLGGAQVGLGKLKLTGRYFVGLNNINDIDNQDKWKAQGFQLSVGLGL